MDRLIFVSSDSHAGVPKELWSEYLDPRFHDLLPGLREDNEVYPTAIFLLGAKGGSTSLPEVRDRARQPVPRAPRRALASGRHGS